MKHPCPICGDPNAFPMWIDDEPPGGCPEDMSWHNNNPPKVRSITECKYQMARAKRISEWMKASPESFDKFGSIIPGQHHIVISKWLASNPSPPTKSEPVEKATE